MNSYDDYWSSGIRLIEKTFVPQIPVGESRPCCEQDFKYYRSTLNKNCQDILSILQLILEEQNETSPLLNSPKARIFKTYSFILIGEHNQKSPWTTVESIKTCKRISEILCGLYSSDNLTQLLEQNDEDVIQVLTTLRPKLLKDTWKTYPAAIICYKWFISIVPKSVIVNHIGDVVPTTLIILDDFETDNKILGLECLFKIVTHCYTEKQFVKLGFAQMVLFNLERFAYDNEFNCTLLFYNCIEKILKALELYNENSNAFEWSERDNILEKLLSKMECLENLQVRQTYMTVLPELLNSVGSYKWCARVIRIVKGYCEHYGDLKTLKITLQNMKLILERFRLRIPVHSETLYSTFLKLYLDLIEIRADEESFQLLEDCIYLVCKSTPETSKAIMQDDRVRTLIKNFRSEFVHRLSEIDVS